VSGPSLPPFRIDPSSGTDGQVLKRVSGEVQFATAGTGTIWVPVTTVDSSGNPTLVWDGNDELVMMEIPTP
jgi:hypothetical protein